MDNEVEESMTQLEHHLIIHQKKGELTWRD